VKIDSDSQKIKNHLDDQSLSFLKLNRRRKEEEEEEEEDL